MTGTTCASSVPAPVVQYQCPGETYNWKNPFKATCACGVGVDGYVFLGTKTDATGQLDTTSSQLQLKSFGVSQYEPCTMTVANHNHLSGIRLSFCDNTGASLMRVSYPNSLQPVEMLNNYYDV